MVLLLSDIEFYKDLLCGVYVLDHKILVQSDLSSSQGAAQGSSNPLLGPDAKNLTSKTRAIIECKDSQDNKSQADKDKERKERKEYHQLFDQVIKQVVNNSKSAGISYGSNANIRSLIYTYLCHCAGDIKSVAESYNKLEVERQDIGALTGLGHASGNSLKNLKALQDILKQFIPAEDDPDKRRLFEGVTVDDLKDALSNCFAVSQSPVMSQLSQATRFEVEKDEFGYIKDIFEELFISNTKENKFKKELKEEFIDFIHGHAVLKNIKYLISKEDILDNLKKQYEDGNFELLDRVIASSLDDNSNKELANSIKVDSFDIFKERMEGIYRKNIEKIRIEHSKERLFLLLQ